MRILGTIFLIIGVFFIIFFLSLLVVGELAYGLLLVALACWALASSLIDNSYPILLFKTFRKKFDSEVSFFPNMSCTQPLLQGCPIDAPPNYQTRAIPSSL
jgi:hypothetical protein